MLLIILLSDIPGVGSSKTSSILIYNYVFCDTLNSPYKLSQTCVFSSVKWFTFENDSQTNYLLVAQILSNYDVRIVTPVTLTS